MVNTFLVQLLVLLWSTLTWGKLDQIYSQGYLGEKRLDGYAGRHNPAIHHDLYRGKLIFQDDIFYQNYHHLLTLSQQWEFTHFLKSELMAGNTCSNEQFSRHFDQIRYLYRLVSLSYFLEGQWHMEAMSRHLRLKNGCQFDLSEWVQSCRPASLDMKKFLGNLKVFQPRYSGPMARDYQLRDWLKELQQKKYQWYSHYRLKATCSGNCSEKDLAANFQRSCQDDQKLMTSICSEEDEIYGLSGNRDAYYLIGLSNAINTFNQSGEALGCLRRFAEVMSHKEVRHTSLDSLFPVIQSYLRNQYQERFLQGRVYFLGSGKEFEEKGLSDLYVKDQTLKIEAITIKEEAPPEVRPVLPVTPAGVVAQEKKVVVADAAKQMVETRTPVKSAFLQAVEVRQLQDLELVEVDMLKLKYDYVFSLNMINNLAGRLKNFMTREALLEMKMYDKLGTPAGPVPLLFLKYLIDMQEHQGLWNIISVLGDKFYVSNEIDASFKTYPEMIQLSNNDSTGRQWQINVLRP